MKILSMSNYIPEHICDTVRFTQYSGDRNISHFCGYASDFISQVVNDPTIDGAVYPKTCDSSRNITSYISDTGKFTYQLNIPYVNSVGSADFFAEVIKSYKEAIESYYSISISDVKARCEIINERNKNIARTYDSLPEISYSSYLSAIHQMMQLPLKKQEFDKHSLDSSNKGGKRAFLIGSFISNLEIVRILEDCGLNIVGDNIPESGRLISSPEVDVKSNLYNSIAHSILSQRLSPSQNCFDTIIRRDAEEIKGKKIEALIFVTEKYCEPYDYLLSVYKRVLKDLPVLHIVVNDTEDSRKVRLMSEAFVESL